MTRLIPAQHSLAARLQRKLHWNRPWMDAAIGISLLSKDSPEWSAKSMQWLLRHGEPMYQGWLQPIGRHDSRCWDNSFAHRLWRADTPDDDRAYYCEGAVLTPLSKGRSYIQLHGWNLRNRHVLDATLGYSWHSRYVGVAFSDAFLRFCYLTTGWGFYLLERFEQTHVYLDNYIERGP